MKKNKSVTKIVCLSVVISFLGNMVFPAWLKASELALPSPIQFVNLSGPHSFAVLKGLKFDPKDPLMMKFIIDNGDEQDVSEEEASNLVRYFLAGLTIPAENLWVNLSPYEKDRVAPDILARTDLGKDLLSQDYLLKQISASLTYPESEIGRDFWSKTYQAILKIAKTTNLPVNTFNKIWIVPDKAVVYENENAAFVAEANLKAMLEEDYLLLKSNVANIQKENKGLQEEKIREINKASSAVMRECILPRINEDINKGKNFATLRQIYHSLILAGWFKKKFKESLYNYYIDKGKIAGIDLEDKNVREKIYNLYLEAFKKGLYNYIKTEKEPVTRKQLKRRYYSGGFDMNKAVTDSQIIPASRQTISELSENNRSRPMKVIDIRLGPKNPQGGKVSSPVESQQMAVNLAREALKSAEGDDYFMKPIIAEAGTNIKEGDSLIEFNFRADRAEPMFRLLTGDPEFKHFSLKKLDLVIAPFSVYNDKYFKKYGFEGVVKESSVTNTLGEVLAQNGKTQVRIAESEKFKHVTWFFDGLRDIKFEGMDTVQIPSNKIDKHWKKPEMKAQEIAGEAVKWIKGIEGREKKDFIVLNFANLDILGHFDNFDAAVEGVLVVDKAIGIIRDAIRQEGGVLIVTADHGSGENMAKLDDAGNPILDAQGKPKPNKAHAFDNKVPFIIEGLSGELRLKDTGSLKNVAPTILEIMGISKPNEMTEDSLFEGYAGKPAEGPVVLLIRDGWGINKFNNPEALKFDAIYQASQQAKARGIKFNDAELRDTSTHTELWAHGEYVGHPYYQMGDSENGHSNLGAGRNVESTLSVLERMLKAGEFSRSKIVRQAIDNAKKGHSLHLLGMVSEGGVHSHIEHLFKLLEVIAKEKEGINKIVLHPVFDGRDVETSEKAGWESLEQVFQKVNELGLQDIFHIGVMAGRYYPMDRDALNRDKKGEDSSDLWNERLKPWYDAIVTGAAGTTEGVSSPITEQIEEALNKFNTVDWEAVIKPVEEGGEKFIYFFGSPEETEGRAEMKSLLGGKGAGLAEMAKLGLPVPFGYTQSTKITQYFFALNQIKKLLEENPGLEESAQGQMSAQLKKAREIIAKFEEKQWQENKKYLAMIEERLGKKFGQPDNPLLVSVRSGAAVSMPGMMDTVLNLGLNDTVVEGLAELTQNPRFAWDAYRRFIQLYSKVVMGVEDLEKLLDKEKEEKGYKEDTQLTVEDLKELVKAYKEKIKEQKGREFPQDPYEQLRLAILAVQESSITARSLEYRRIEGIKLEESFSAVNVVAMVFGNMGEDSGTGVAFTRDTATGEKRFNLEFLPNAQGEDVVAGKRMGKSTEKELKPHPAFGKVFTELEEIQKKLEEHYHNVQDIEFTVEKGKLFFLQTRNAKRTIKAAIVTAVDMVEEGLISKEEAIKRISNPNDLEILLNPQFDPGLKKRAIEEEGRFITNGLGASPGAAMGQAVFSSEEAVRWAKEGKKVILVRLETAPEDLHGMIASRGILTSRGGRTSHAAVVARQFGKPAVVGAGEISIDYQKKVFSVKGKIYQEGEWISIDGATGEVIEGELPTIASLIEQARNVEGLEELEGIIARLDNWIGREENPSLREQYEQYKNNYLAHIAKYKDVVLTPEDWSFYQKYKKLLNWEKEFRTLGVAANAEEPLDVFSAVLNGAERIGLARTEHMFFAPERLETVQEMILASNAQSRQQALNKLLPFQQADFEQIFLILKGRPVTIRLIDPPLHEFLPRVSDTKRINELAQRLGIGPEEVKARINNLKEENPMFGTRGVRLSIVMPEIIEMQAKAIFNAVRKVKVEGIDVHPEIMVPLVGNLQEYELAEKSIVKVAEESGFGRQEYLVGTMIELIAAALNADQIARKAQFFSFGTNDLTQGTYKFSRDDAGAFVIPGYMEKGILPVDPFVSIAPEVGEFLKMAVYKGRQVNPKLKIGICGEQGLNPESIRNILSRVGLDYVSGGSRRIPIARLTASQEALKGLPLVSEPVIKVKELPSPAPLASAVAEIASEQDISAQLGKAVAYVSKNVKRRQEAIREALVSLDINRLFQDGKINIDLMPKETKDNFEALLAWANQNKDLEIIFNANTATQINQGHKQEAEINQGYRHHKQEANGIGLLSTEELFLGSNVITLAQRAVLAPTDEKKDEALSQLLSQQRGYFEGIFGQAIDGEVINIRLLDLELGALFKGLSEKEEEALAGLLDIEKGRLEGMISKLEEANPALGNRGIRLALTTHPKLYANLLKAIFSAAVKQKQAGKNIHLGILWPMVINAAEFKQAKEFTDKIAQGVLGDAKATLDYKVIPVIETPSAAITVQNIASLSGQVVIDTKGLTEGVLGAFEADAAKGFLAAYRQQGIWPFDPFQMVFEENAGLLIREVIRRAKEVNPEIKVSAVRYGDNQPSIEFYQRAGIDTVSVNPENIPFANFAAAQAAIKFPRSVSSPLRAGNPVLERIESKFNVSTKKAPENVITPKADFTPGGIDLQGIDVSASDLSKPVSMPLLFDPQNFDAAGFFKEGVTFRIIKLEVIKDLSIVLNTAPA